MRPNRGTVRTDFEHRGFPMDDATARQTRINSISALAAAALQTVTTAEALFVTADEYDPASMVWISLGLDAGIAVAFGIFFVQLLKTPPGTPWRSVGLPAAAIASLLSLLQVAIRFTSDHGWWTGHINYALS
jgi:hypothetical protein